MAFYTDESILAVFPQAADLPADQVSQALADAGGVYAYVQAHPGISESDLRAWAETQAIDPDRMTLALQVLRQAGKLFSLGGAGAVVVPEQGSPAPDRVVAVLVDSFTAGELRDAAERAGAEVAKSATKQQLAEAITSSAAR